MKDRRSRCFCDRSRKLHGLCDAARYATIFHHYDILMLSMTFLAVVISWIFMTDLGGFCWFHSLPTVIWCFKEVFHIPFLWNPWHLQPCLGICQLYSETASMVVFVFDLKHFTCLMLSICDRLVENELRHHHATYQSGLNLKELDCCLTCSTMARPFCNLFGHRPAMMAIPILQSSNAQF